MSTMVQRSAIWCDTASRPSAERARGSSNAGSAAHATAARPSAAHRNEEAAGVASAGAGGAPGARSSGLLLLAARGMAEGARLKGSQSPYPANLEYSTRVPSTQEEQNMSRDTAHT